MHWASIIKLSGLSSSSLNEAVGLAVCNLLLDVLAVLEHLFPSDDVGDAFGEGVEEGGLAGAESVGFGDVPGASGRCGVDTGGSTGLELHAGADVLEVGAHGDLGDLDRRCRLRIYRRHLGGH